MTITINSEGDEGKKGAIQAAKDYRAITVNGTSCKLVLNNVVLNGSGSAPVSETSYKTNGGIVTVIKSDIEANDCVFQNGINSADGGALYVSAGNINLNNCKFKNNESNKGGAIAFYKAFNISGTFNCLLTNCEFDENTADKDGGGALSLDGVTGNCLIKECKFNGNVTGTQNSSSAKGGAINFSSCSSATINIEDCEFFDNSAPYSYGGAINSYDNSSTSNKLSTITIANSAFENNSASRGGAICLRADELVLDSSTIVNNEATYDSVAQRNKGVMYPGTSTSGGVHFFPGKNGAVFTVQGNSQIYGNKAEKEVSSLTFNGLGVASEVYIQDTKTWATSVENLDGLTSVDAAGSTHVITRYEYPSSVGKDYRYTQRFYSVKHEPERIYFDPDNNNNCNHTPSDSTQVYSDFAEAVKAAKEKDSTIYVCDSVAINAENTEFVNLNDGDTMTYIRCSGNNKKAMFNVSGEVAFRNVTLDGNSVESSAPMVTVAPRSNVTIGGNSVFQNAYIAPNQVDKGGAAIAASGSSEDTTLTICDSAKFKNNKALASSTNGKAANGGAIYCNGVHLVITGGSFEYNSAVQYGGAMYTIDNSVVDISGGTFVGNSAKMGGALAFWSTLGGEGTVSTITGGSFRNNSSVRESHTYYGGGAIYNEKHCHLTVYNAIITGNLTSDHETGCHKAAVSNCITGSMETYKVDGVLVYNNSHDNYWFNDNSDIGFCTEKYGVYDSNNPPKSPMATVSDYVLGGGSANWTGTNGEDIKQSKYQNSYESFSLVSHPTPETIAKAEAQAKVWFIGNSSNNSGSAIMNNGDMTFGGDRKNLLVKKEWMESDQEGNSVSMTDAPESVTFQLAVLKNGSNQPELVDTTTRNDAIQTVTANEDWTAFWADLGSSDGYEWTAVEIDSPAGFKSETSKPEYGENEHGIPWVKYTITNTWNNEVINISAEKIWKDDNNLYQIRPNAVELTLMTDQGATDTNENGKIDEDEFVAAGDSVEVESNDEGIWRWEFKDLAKYSKKGQELHYYIKETPVEGYASTVEAIKTPAESTIWFDKDNKEWSGYNIINSLDYGELTINKKLEGAVSTMGNGEGNSTAVFHVEGTWGNGENAKKIYDNYVAINFSNPGEASATLHGLLVGANYTVTEVVPSGSGYAIKEGTEPVQVGMLNKAEDNGTAKVSFSFENVSNNEDHPNYGVINTYNYDSDAQKLRVSIQGALDALAGN